MPESRGRDKTPFTPPPAKSNAAKPSPRWWVPVMVGLLIIGLLYIVVSYLSDFAYPAPIGRLNIAAGFAIMMAGFAMTTRWR